MKYVINILIALAGFAANVFRFVLAGVVQAGRVDDGNNSHHKLTDTDYYGTK